VKKGFSSNINSFQFPKGIGMNILYKLIKLLLGA
jgi:hypothetical protein